MQIFKTKGPRGGGPTGDRPASPTGQSALHDSNHDPLFNIWSALDCREQVDLHFVTMVDVD